MSGIDLDNLPKDPWERRSTLLLHDFEARTQAAISFLRDEYPDHALLETCRLFVCYDLNDAPRSDWGSLRRVWFFPWTEIQRELSEVLNHAILATYKAAFDNCRRALELAVVAAYFLQEHVPESQARKWLCSERQTPLFTRAIPLILRSPRFAAADAATAWSSTVKDFYWRLCDIIHVRGEKAAFQELQPSHFFINDVSSREFSTVAISKVADAFVETVRHVATIVALENPVLLVGLDLISKFGLNPPASGFFEEPQSDRLRTLVLPSVSAHALAMVEQDDEVQSIQRWVDGLPQLTSEQLEQQIQHQDEFLKSMAPPDDSKSTG